MTVESDAPGEGLIPVRRVHLELRDPAALRGEPWRASDVRLERRDGCTVAEYRAMYRDVGARWAWRNRNAWSDAMLGAYLARDDVHVWVVRAPDGSAGGFFELQRMHDGAVEIVYFGLAESLHGRRLGAQLLTAAVTEAWALGATHVVLNTCSLDSPRALPNYLARGFTPVREETYWTTPPDAA